MAALAAVVFLVVGVCGADMLQAGFIEDRIMVKIASSDIARLPVTEQWMIERLERSSNGGKDGAKDMVLQVDPRQLRIMASLDIYFTTIVSLFLSLDSCRILPSPSSFHEHYLFLPFVRDLCGIVE